MKRPLLGMSGAVRLTGSPLVGTTVHGDGGAHGLTSEGSWSNKFIGRCPQIGAGDIGMSWCCGQHGWMSSYVP